jgi:glucan phosphoethanolaminetransferase (alkaline phosphatase superfamily)
VTEIAATEPVEPVEPQSILKPKQPIGILTLVIAAVFGLFFAYFVYQAIENLIELPKSYEAITLGESVPWVLLVIGLAIPVILYVIAFVITLRRPVLDKLLIFVMALSTAAAFSYGVVAIHRVTFDALIASL